MSRLGALRIFVVEDESLILMLLRDMIEQLGHVCAFEARRLDAALKLARDAEFDLAVLDVNVKDEMTYTVAETIIARGLPVVFATGYGPLGLEAGYQDLPILQKPFDLCALRNAIDLAMQRSRGGSEG